MQCNKEDRHLSVNLILRWIMNKQQTFKILLTKTPCHVNSISLPSPRILSNPSSLTMMNILKKSIHSYFIRLQENLKRFLKNKIGQISSICISSFSTFICNSKNILIIKSQSYIRWLWDFMEIEPYLKVILANMVQ